MADKTNNILIGDVAIDVPAWASEITLENLSIQTGNAVKLTDEMLQAVRENTKLDDDLIDAVKINTEVGTTNAKNNEANAKGKTSILLKGAQAIKDTASFFGDSEKPLSSMVSATENLVGKMKGSSGKLDKASAEGLPFVKALQKYSKQVGSVAVDIGFAWAGWNAAKFEQFAEVQKMMIDSGAVVYDTADVFDELYNDSFQMGITYKSFASVIQNFGGTMVGIGGDTSKGSRSFLKMFKTLSDNTDVLGDLGMSNVDLMNSYAGFIEAQRLTGQLDKQLVNEGQPLEEAYKQLVLEAGALANLTSLTRSEAMSKQLAALSDTSLAAGLSQMEDNNFDKSAEAVRIFMKQIALFNDVGTGDLLGTLTNAINKTTSIFSNNPENFDLRPVLNQLDATAAGRLEILMPGLIDKFNNSIRTAETSTTGMAENFLIKEIANFNRDKLMSTELGSISDEQESFYLILKNFGNLTKLSVKDQANILKGSMEESGKSTKSMNDMSKMFLTAQEFITMDMQNFGENLDFVSGLLEDSAQWLSGKFNDYKGDTSVVGPDYVGDKLDSDNSSTNNSTSKVSLSNFVETSPLPVNAKAVDLPRLKDRLTYLQSNSIITAAPGDRTGALAARKEKQLNDEIAATKLMIEQIYTEIRHKENIKFQNDAREAMGYIN